MCPVNRRGLGNAKHVEVHNWWIQEASKSGKFVTKKVETDVNPAGMMTKQLPRLKIGQLMKLIGHELVENDQVNLMNET